MKGATERVKGEVATKRHLSYSNGSEYVEEVEEEGIQAWVLEGDCRQNVKHRDVRVLSLRFLARIPSDSPPGTHRSTLPYCLVVLSAYSSLTSSPLGPTLQFPLFFT